MKKQSKLFMLVITIIIGSLLTGFSKEDKNLTNAFIKSQEILSLESTSNVEFKLDVKGLDDETKLIFDEVINQINGMKLSTKQKSISNEEQNIAKGQMDANIQLADMNFDSSIWVDLDLTGEEPLIKEIFKFPSMLMNFLPGGNGKEYIVLDLQTMNESFKDVGEDGPEAMNLKETMSIAMKYQDKFMDAFTNYIKNYDSDLSNISKLDTKEVDGEKIQYYKVEFDNDSFKEFLKYTTISILQDENIIPLFEEYTKELMLISGEEMPEELSVTENIGEVVKKTQEFFEILEKVNLLGEEGINIIFGINEEGYFISEEGKIDFLINTEEIMNLMPKPTLEEEALVEGDYELPEMPTPIFELMISYDTKIDNINEDMEITMPKTTKENSIDYMELIENMLVESQENMELMVIFEDELVDFTKEPILENGRYLVSSRDISEAFDASITWDQDTEEITISKDENKLVFNENSDKVLVNGVSKDLNGSVVIVDGVSFIPLRDISENFGYNIDWDGDFKLISIYK